MKVEFKLFRGAVRPVTFRGAVLGAASSGLLLISSGAAWASAGCDAVNAGGFNDAIGGSAGFTSSPKAIAGFAAGDKIDFKINILSGVPNGVAWFLISAGGTVIDRESTGIGIYTHSYTVAGNDTNLRSELGIQDVTSSLSVTATCVARPPVVTDSQKLRAVQVQGSTIVAQTSGAAITGSVDGAIDEAFNDGGRPVSFGPNGMAMNFAALADADAAAGSETSRGAEEALNALPYAGGYKKASPLKSPIERQWSVWADIRGTGWDRTNTSADLKGTQLNVTAGIGYKLRPDLLVGLFGGYENFNYDIASLTGKLTGDGGTVGGYAAWRIAPTLRWDVMAGWSGIGYDGTAGTASGSFIGSRWIASTGLTGSYRVTSYVFEPSAKVYALWEHQGAWTDSLGALQASRDFSTGRVSAGGRVIAPWQMSSVATLSPYLGVYGDWRFATDNALPTGVAFVGIGDGWSARVTGGVNVAMKSGGMLALGGEYGGLGANYGVWTANARVNWPF